MTDTSKGLDLLKFLLNREDTKAAESAAWVSVAAQHEMNKEMQRSLRWHQEQVNARQRAAGCEVADIPDDTGGGGNTLFNCTFNGDRAVEQITKAVSDIGTDPVQPPPPQPIPPANPPKWWRWVIATLLTVLFGALLILVSYLIFSDPSGGQQELIGGNLPYQQPKPFTGFDQ